MKKASKVIEILSTTDSLTLNDFEPLENIILDLNSEVDKAVEKGILHSNTGERRKSRIAQAKKKRSESA